ncbi:unnamed protein product [Adineta ricciae]|uniref:Uncharacterized protein n=1 Tax=Adineta ricciae TaxID=249248 RepID=A0A813P707_ADIRI|nr:unnamed protein product [Adineta ricciae]
MLSVTSRGEKLEPLSDYLFNHFTISTQSNNSKSRYSDLDKFQFGASLQQMNSNLPKKFTSLTWEDGELMKFIPSNTTFDDVSYICFLFDY